jgi:hypothetical protein
MRGMDMNIKKINCHAHEAGVDFEVQREIIVGSSFLGIKNFK